MTDTDAVSDGAAGQRLRLLVVPGSIREGALSPQVAARAAAALEQAGHDVTSFDLRPLPMMGIVPKEAYPPVVRAWQDAIAGADGVLWVVPTYHADMPGVVKNSLDLVGSKRISGQIMGVIGASSGSGLLGAQALSRVLRALGARLPLPDHLVPGVDTGWGNDAALHEGVDGFAQAFAATTAWLRREDAPRIAPVRVMRL